jgi:hypothetical protein
MLGGFVLDDLQDADARALFAPAAQEETAVARWCQGNGACRRQVGVGIEVFGDTDGMLENGGVDVVVGIEIDPAQQLDELSGPGPVVAAGLVEGFTDEVEGHFITFTRLRNVKGKYDFIDP